MRAHSIDNGMLSERYTTCHGTYDQHFTAITQRLAKLGDGEQLSQSARTCIPRPLLHLIDAHFRINALYRLHSLATRADNGSGESKLKPLLPIDLVTQQQKAQKQASMIVKIAEFESFRQSAVKANAKDVVARIDDSSSFGAGDFLSAIPVGNDRTGGFALRSDHWYAGARRLVGLTPHGMEPKHSCLKCNNTLDANYNTVGTTRGAVCGSFTRASCHASWCSRGTHKNKSHNAVADVLCEMWVALGGSASSDHKSMLINGR